MEINVFIRPDGETLKIHDDVLSIDTGGECETRRASTIEPTGPDMCRGWHVYMFPETVGQMIKYIDIANGMDLGLVKVLRYGSKRVRHVPKPENRYKSVLALGPFESRDEALGLEKELINSTLQQL